MHSSLLVGSNFCSRIKWLAGLCASGGGFSISFRTDSPSSMVFFGLFLFNLFFEYL